MELPNLIDHNNEMYPVPSEPIPKSIFETYERDKSLDENGFSITAFVPLKEIPSEDIPYALVPMVSISEELGVDLPIMRSFIHLFSINLNVDYLKEGLTADKLGLKGMSKKEIYNLVMN